MIEFKAQALPAGGLESVAADALLVVLCGEAPARHEALGAAIAAALDEAIADGDLEAKPGKALLLRRVPGVKAKRLAFAFAADGSPAAVRKAIAAALALVKAAGVARLAATLVGEAATAAHGEALAVLAGEAAYLYRTTKPSAPPPPKLASVVLFAAKAELAEVTAGVARGAAIAAGQTLARELANRPGNHCTPTMLGEEAKALAKGTTLKVEVLDRKAIEKLGMGSFLAVAQGSEEPPRFIVMRHLEGPKGQAPIVLVGKGITFDTGGISLKPGAEMDEMKFDMGGAASVIGTMRALGALRAKVNVIGLVAATENMPDGRAVKPGDVVTSMSGQTIEILNTDAEGRLILCDALTYAERFEPAAVVDVATLTGACVIALGGVRTGLFSPDDALAGALLAAGEAAFDPAWRLPLDEAYDESLKSHFADVANIGGRAAGAVTAAKFLQRFAGKLRWAHLDIAGTGWKSGAAKGATGRPVPLLVHFVLAHAAAAAA
jgi:leucyl aminopeptidase